MRGDTPNAALRIMAQLPVRTHIQARPAERGENMRLRHWNTGKTGKPPRALIATKPRKVVTGVGGGGANRRTVVIDGNTYSSLTAARNAHGIGHDTLALWLDTGRATYGVDQRHGLR